MSVIQRSRLYLLLGCCSILFGLAIFMNAYADTLDNGLKEWDPWVIQGTIMDTGKDSVVVSEKWIRLIDTTLKGKHLKTRIIDGKGVDRPNSLLKKGVLILAMGGLAWDDKLATNVLLATEIQILDSPVNLDDVNIREKLQEQNKPW